MENDVNFAYKEEDFDPHDADVEGEEIKTSKECQTLHERLVDEINGVIKSLETDKRIRKIINENKTYHPAPFKKQKEERRHGVSSSYISIKFTFIFSLLGLS